MTSSSASRHLAPKPFSRRAEAIRRTHAYPARIVEAAAGEFLVTFRDVPQAMASTSSFIEAATCAPDALKVALEGLVLLGFPLPRSSPTREGEHLVQVTL